MTIDAPERLVDGEVYVYSHPHGLTSAAAVEVRDHLREILPGKRVLVLTGGATITPLSHLDAAWRRAEVAIPDDPDWGGPCVYRYDNLDGRGPYGASASPPGDTGKDSIYGYGPTPAAALDSLAERLEAI